MIKPRICIIKTDGTNCDQETAYAFEKAGGSASIVSLNHLKTNALSLNTYNIVAIPGGFSYGDDIASGKVFALELITFFKEQLEELVARGNLIMGICNGFQVLIQMGLLPFNTISTKQASLTHNDSGTFECRWITMMVEKSPCIFTKHLEGSEITLQVAHGEGKFFAYKDTLTQLEQMNLAVLRYTHQGKATAQYPDNPNGSAHAIAGICDPTGRIFGLMPHPERYVERYHHPEWRTNNTPAQPQGLGIFEQAINYFK